MDKNRFRIIAVDFDGTLLRSDKTISPFTRRTLLKAHREGYLIIPCTGRVLSGIPDFISKLNICDYYITCNGANIIDARSSQSIANAFFPYELSVDIMEYMKGLNTYFDCYSHELGYVSQSFLDNLEEYVGNKQIRELVFKTRSGVDDLLSYVKERHLEIEKMQMFFRDETEREAAIQGLRENFKDIVVTSSLKNNVEINYHTATKGEGIRKLCAYLEIPVSEVITFGDSSNDESMLDIGSFGVVMGNGDYELKKKADYIADNNDNDGVAKAIVELLLK